MQNKITLVNDKVFECRSNEIILSAAARQKLVLEHSCRTGRCGVCKTSVLSGDTKAIKEEVSLTHDEKEQGFILTCCRTALTDITIDIEDQAELANIQVKTLPCRVDKITKLNANILEITLRTPPNCTLEYLPGQYIDVIGAKGLRRSYSIANAPRQDKKIILNIRQVENGEMSDYWFNQAKVNDLLRLEGPLGTFYLRDKAAKNIILIATGTGIAPIKAILEKLEQYETQQFKNIYLIWGGRTQQDIYWQPDFKNLLLKFIPVLSRSEDSWQGEKGYVQEAVLKKEIDLAESIVYACGSDTMIQSARLLLTQHGLNQKDFYSDAFVSSN